MSLLLSLLLLCAQGVGLHVHNLDHGHDDNQSHGHAHVSQAHFAHDTSHKGHQGNVTSEIDVSPDGLLKIASNNVFAIALITFFFILIIDRYDITYFLARQLV